MDEFELSKIKKLFQRSSDEHFLSKENINAIVDYINNYNNTISCCPHCKSNSIIKNGKNRLLKQRYKCKSCGKIFCSSTFSPLYYSKKPLSYWINYFICMCNCLSVRNSANKTGIHRNTSFHWRHKTLYCLKSILSSNLEGTIEIDETYFNNSRKSVNRKQTLNNDSCNSNFYHKVCVVSCIDENNNIFSKTACLNTPSSSVINSLLHPIIPIKSVICTKNSYRYESFAKLHDLEIHKISRVSVDPISKFNLFKVRTFERALHRLITKFRGVSVKYMDFYISWNKWKTLNSQNSLFQIIKTTAYSIVHCGENLKISDFKAVRSID